MIRFRTIEPAEAEKPAPQPAPLAPRAAAPALAAEDSGDAARDKPKGLARKAPLRAKKAEAAPLFDK